ncbi:hypothetical protein AAF463_23455 (plasmid) [Pantoea sp. BJ2]|uniref:NR LBD domain-containing protein n=1 Tax=Pantoea sp. BJ2 TaxID=3141322 RepID=A0AAU7U428_9GAMM
MHYKNAVNTESAGFAKMCVGVHHFDESMLIGHDILGAFNELNEDKDEISTDAKVTMYDHYMEINECLMDMDCTFFQQVMSSGALPVELLSSARIYYLDISYFHFFQRHIYNGEFKCGDNISSLATKNIRSKEQLIYIRNQLHPSLRDCFMILTIATMHYTLTGIFYEYFEGNGFYPSEIFYLRCVSDMESGLIPFMLELSSAMLAYYDDDKRRVMFSALRYYMYTVLTMHENLSFLSNSRQKIHSDSMPHCFFNKLKGILKLDEILTKFKADALL